MLVTKLGAYGNTELTAGQLRLLAREALSSQTRTRKVNVFFMDTPHSGGTSEPLNVTFDLFEGDNEELLLGHLPSGAAIVFFLRDPAKTVTFVTQLPA